MKSNQLFTIWYITIKQKTNYQAFITKAYKKAIQKKKLLNRPQ